MLNTLFYCSSLAGVSQYILVGLHKKKVTWTCPPGRCDHVETFGVGLLGCTGRYMASTHLRLVLLIPLNKLDPCEIAPRREWRNCLQISRATELERQKSLPRFGMFPLPLRSYIYIYIIYIYIIYILYIYYKFSDDNLNVFCTRYSIARR